MLAFIAFWVLTAIYISLVGEPDQQELTRDLREEESLSALIGYGVLLAFVAPLAEEVFFRGFVFGVLREKIGVVWGALATGLVFGLVHVAGSPIETVGVLIILGTLLCALYVQTGSLLPCIALHAINNSISFAATKSLPWTAGVAIVVASTGAAVAVGGGRHEPPERCSVVSRERLQVRDELAAELDVEQEAGRLGAEVERLPADLEPGLQVRARRGHDAAAAEHARTRCGARGPRRRGGRRGSARAARPSAARCSAGSPISSSTGMPVSSGGWCIAITTGRPRVASSCASSQSRSSSPSSRPGSGVSHATSASSPTSAV